MTQATFVLQGRNPDVLTCIANLSNDEVFTPPELANRMLDGLAEAWAAQNDGASIWADKTVRFLDPFTKSGVFLREITKRLVDGLAAEIPDLGKRVDHILTKQVFGIAITELTALLARRSVYCSKYADGKHSIAKSFATPSGNIWFERTEHTWDGGKCKFCGAAKAEYQRSADQETHAYAFTHTDDATSLFTEAFGEPMQFDVIIGNPPYQLSDGGLGGSARPIYNLFVQQAMRLEPRHLVMVTPSRWFAGGKGLDSFRDEMIGDHRLEKIVDFIVDKDAFPNVNINGGVNYFLWSRNHDGPCDFTSVLPGGSVRISEGRYLDEFDVIIRRNEALSILRKVRARSEPGFEHRVSPVRPFGLRTFYHGADTPTRKRNIKFYGSGKVSWVAESELTSNVDWVPRWKVLIPAASDGNENYPLPIWDQVGPFVASPGEACSETYLVASLAGSAAEAERIAAYMRTKFFRFLVSLRKVAQHNKVDNFSFVPDLDTRRRWTDELLYERYELDEKEVDLIESTIRTMSFGHG